MASTTNSFVNEVKAIVRRVETAAHDYYLHLSAQAFAWLIVAEHDLTKWESAAASAGTLAVTGLLKKVQSWVKSA